MRFLCRPAIIFLLLSTAACSYPPKTAAQTVSRILATLPATNRPLPTTATISSKPEDEIILATPTPNSQPARTVMPSPTKMHVLSSERPYISVETAQDVIVIGKIAYSPWDLVTAISWHPAGDVIAIAAGDKIYVYQAADQEEIVVLNVGAFSHSIAFSPDGSLLAAGSRDGVVRIWKMAEILSLNENSTANIQIEAHKKGVNIVAFSRDGTRFASGGNDAVARFWNPNNGEQLGMLIGGTFAVPSLAFSPVENVLAVVNGDVIRLRDAASESIRGTFLAQDSLYSLAYHPDGNLLAAGGVDNLIRIWIPEQAFRTGVEKYPEPVLLDGHSGDTDSYRALIWQVKFSPDGRILASAGGDASVRLWNPSTGEQLVSLEAHNASVTCLDFSPDGSLLASGGLDGIVFFWGNAER